MSNNTQNLGVPVRTHRLGNYRNITLREILTSCQEEGQLLPVGSTFLVAKAILKGLANSHREGRSNGFVLPEQIKLLEKEQNFVLGPSCVGQFAGENQSWEDVVIYMAPEAAIDGIWSSASDIFSAGVVLWQCLMGLYPFQYRDSESLQEIIQHLVNDPPLLSAGQEDDRGLLLLASAMLAKEPQERPSAEQLLQTVCIGQSEPACMETVRPLLLENLETT